MAYTARGMPKVILEFTLPEEKSEADIALNAGKYSLCIWDIEEHLRKELKYMKLGKRERAALEKVQRVLYDSKPPSME